MVVQYNGPHHNTQYKQNGSPLLEPGCQTSEIRDGKMTRSEGIEVLRGIIGFCEL